MKNRVIRLAVLEALLVATTCFLLTPRSASATHLDCCPDAECSGLSCLEATGKTCMALGSSCTTSNCASGLPSCGET